jgi:pimeloyl-ACP methyl ester carboxylesterase
MVNVFSHSMLAPPPSALGPGTWIYGASRALMRRVLASNTQANVFYTGFKACDSYTGGEAAMEKVKCPVLFVLGSADHMAPPKGAQSLTKLAPTARTAMVPAGHQMMVEAPEEVLAALKQLLLG